MVQLLNNVRTKVQLFWPFFSLLVPRWLLQFQTSCLHLWQEKKRKGWSSLCLSLWRKLFSRNAQENFCWNHSGQNWAIMQRNWKSGEWCGFNWLDQSWCLPWSWTHNQGFLMWRKKRTLTMTIPYHPRTVKVPYRFMILSEYKLDARMGNGFVFFFLFSVWFSGLFIP